MNPKVKKIIAIIGLVFMGLFLVSMFVYFINRDLLNGMLWLLAVICLGVAVVMFCAIYFTKGFPSQQVKADEFKRLEEAYYKKLAEQKEQEEAAAAAQKAAENNSPQTESAADNQAADNQAADKQAADNQAADKQATDNQAADNQATDNQAK